MLTAKGQEILRIAQNAHRWDYLERYEGASENDIERDFVKCLITAVPMRLQSFEKIKVLIEEIR